MKLSAAILAAVLVLIAAVPAFTQTDPFAATNARLREIVQPPLTAEEMETRVAGKLLVFHVPHGWSECQKRQLGEIFASLPKDSNATYAMVKRCGPGCELNPLLRSLIEVGGPEIIHIYFAASAVNTAQTADRQNPTVRTIILTIQNLLQLWALSTHGIAHSTTLFCTSW